MPKHWLVPGGIALALAGLAATASRWGPVLLEFAGANAAAIEGLTGLVQLVLWAGAGGVLLLRLVRSKTATSPIVPSVSPEPAAPATAIAISSGDMRRHYLECLVRENEFLSLAGVDPAVAARGDRETRLRLPALYTGLLTRSSAEEGDPRRALERQARPVSAVEQLNRQPRLVLLGDPGSGKSTFVQIVALALAEGALRSGTGLDLLTAPLPKKDGEDEDHPQPWTHGALLPLRVVLRDLAARGLPAPGERAGAAHLWSFIKAQLEAQDLGAFFPALQEELRERGLLLLDGLDEVPEAEQRREQIREMVERFAASCGHCRILVTSRPYAYLQQEWRLPGFTEASLAEWHEGQIRRFVRRWYQEAAYQGRFQEENATGRAEQLLRAIFANPRIHELARRPLLLALIASLHAWRGGSLPEGRGALYENAVVLLLDFWEMGRVERGRDGEPLLPQRSLAEFLQVTQEKVRRALEELAFRAHHAQPAGGEAGTADIREGDLLSLLMRLRKGTDPALLLEYLRDRAGLLVPRGNTVYAFPHRTLQEYLAACHLVRDSAYPGTLVRLTREDPDRWREVVLLAAARAAETGLYGLWALVDALLEQDPEGAEGPAADPWCVLWAGLAVAERADLPDDRTTTRWLARLRPLFVRLLGDGRLPAADRARAGQALARWGDPRPEVTTVDGMQFRTVEAGPFRMGSEEGDREADEAERPAHDCEIPYSYQMARYPVTVAQFREFVESEGFEPGHPDCLAGAANTPVVWVSWKEALAFCDWLTARWRGSGRLGAEERVTLPSEAEWEKAARGTDGRRYPWGPEADPERANFNQSGIGGVSAVGCFPLGESPYHCEEMSGNVWEWTRSKWGEDWGKPAFGYPYAARDGRESIDPKDSKKMLRVLRGGSYFGASGLVRCAYRFGVAPGDRFGDLGFRVVLLPFSSGL